MIIAAFILIVFLLILLSFVWPPDSPWSPWWRTNRKVARAAGKLLKLKKGDVVYELGSGDGEFILMAAKEARVKRAIGIEIDHSRYFISIIKKYMVGADSAVFVRSDFKTVKLSDANAVYFYLVPAVIKRLLPKLKKELKPGTPIVSLKYRMSLPLVKEDKKNRLYLYKI